MERERKVWQDKNADNIKRLLKENDTQQLWNGVRRLTEVKKTNKGGRPSRSKRIF
jgi:glycerol-3-phosphate dehydrogenase